MQTVLHDPRQTTRHVLMIRPAVFGPNEQTANSNQFQQPADRPPAVIQQQARAEFERMVAALRAAGVHVIVFDDDPSPPKPDAIFPNNWLTTHQSGEVILYPLAAPNRRAERRTELLADLAGNQGFEVACITDLSAAEHAGQYLEGTGSLVLDRLNRVAYAGLSARTDPGLLNEFAARTGYAIQAFETRDAHGMAVYHTNVMLAIGTRFAVLCPSVIAGQVARDAVLSRLRQNRREVIEITAEQMSACAGNLLELRGTDDEPVIVISKTACHALDDQQRARLQRFGRLLEVDIATVERVGGGSARCMLAEIFLPRRDETAAQPSAGH